MNRVVNLVRNIQKVIYKIKPCLSRRAQDEKKRNEKYNDEEIVNEAIL
jgi:hypothetical protein